MSGPLKAFYFGAWGVPGHGLYKPGGRSPDRRTRHLLEGHIDAQYAPRRHEYSRELCWCRQGTTDKERKSIEYKRKELPQGKVLRHSINGFTMISWWDRNQGDRRPGCNSNFLLDGEHTSETMLEKFRELFPTIAANLDKADIKLVDVTPSTDE